VTQVDQQRRLQHTQVQHRAERLHARHEHRAVAACGEEFYGPGDVARSRVLEWRGLHARAFMMASAIRRVSGESGDLDAERR
jgi:hypothetical protein